MPFLQRLLGRDDKFYNLLEQSAQEAHASTQILLALMPKVGDERAINTTIEQLAQSRRKHKKITQEITQSLCRTFVTPLEREDIEELSSTLTRVPKTIEKIGERLLIHPLGSHAQNMARHVAMLEAAAATVLTMVKSLRKRPHVEEVQDEYSQLQTLEGDADHFMIALLRELYQQNADAKDILFLKDVYELLEKAIDRCRDAGNVVFQVVLKYS